MDLVRERLIALNIQHPSKTMESTSLASWKCPYAQMDKQQLNYAIAQCAVIMNEAPSGIIGHAVRCLVQDIDEAVKVERYRRFDA